MFESLFFLAIALFGRLDISSMKANILVLFGAVGDETVESVAGRGLRDALLIMCLECYKGSDLNHELAKAHSPDCVNC